MSALSRRAALKALAAAPAIAQKAAEEAVGASVEASAIDHAIGSAPSLTGLHGSTSKTLALAELAKAGMLPDWARRQIVRNTSGYDRRLEPNVACLQSVSLGQKIRISADRRFDRAVGSFGQEALDHQLMAKFFGWKDVPG